MAGKPRAGRKPAKNETAAALIAAVNFMGVLKTPPAGSLEQYAYTFINAGYAIGFDGVVAAGHPVPEGVQGYPHTKLLGEALENTDKTFTLTVRENGALEVNADKYSAIVPTMDPGRVIQTFPDGQQVAFGEGEADKFVAALTAVNKVIADTGTTALYSSVNFSQHTIKATNGKIIVEVLHGIALPSVTVPKQFVNAILKAIGQGKALQGMGLEGSTWATFTVWFTDGSWLRSNLFGNDVWTEEVLAVYNEGMAHVVNSGAPTAEIPAKLWATIKAVMPFAEKDEHENTRVIIREGLVRTHIDRKQGAALEIPDVHFGIDVDGKSFLTLEETATHLAVAPDETLAVFYGGDTVRGLVMGLPSLAEPVDGAGGTWTQPDASAAPQGWGAPDPAPEPAQGGWTAPADNQPAPAAVGNGGWAVSAAPLPPEEGESPRREAQQSEWVGGPAPGTAESPEFLSQVTGLPETEFTPDLDGVFIFGDQDNGIDLPKFGYNGSFTASGWLNNVTDQDGGFNS